MTKRRSYNITRRPSELFFFFSPPTVCVSLHCWRTHVNHLCGLFEAVIMVYHTLQMHCDSPILTRPTYIITRGRRHYICMCMYIITYVYIHRYTCYRFIYVLCVYTCLHIPLYFYLYIHIYICCFSFPVCGWCANESVDYEIT